MCEIVKQLVEYDSRNMMHNVFIESDLDTNGVEVRGAAGGEEEAALKSDAL